MRAKLIAGCAATVLAMSGCATTGSDKFVCSGIPGKTVCSSAEDNYRKTEGDLSESPWKKGGDGKGPAKTGKVEERVVLPASHDPVPIRTPARVMRIWIAPWEDKEGDLHMASLVYSEVESRRWVVGEKVGDAGLGVGVWSATPNMPIGKQ